MPPRRSSPPRHALDVELTRVLEERARQGELRISTMRIAIFALLLLLDVGLGIGGIRPWSQLIYSLPATLACAGFHIVIGRAPPARWQAVAAPLFDAALAYVILTWRGTDMLPQGALRATAAVFCALLAATGGIRLQARSTLWSTSCALLLYGWFLVLPDLKSSHGGGGLSSVYGLLALGGVGFVAHWTAELSRGVVQASRSREALRRFLPEELLDRAFDDGAVHRIPPRTVDATVLFTDIRGFTSWSEPLDPDAVLATLNEVQGMLAKEVQRHGGVVDKFLGDGMLAVFGTEEQPDHAAQAIAAIGGLRHALRRYNEASQTPFRLGISAHSGPVVVGCLGSDERLEMTVIGDTVNTAARLESLTKELGVDALISAATATRAQVVLPELTEVQLRGKQIRWTVHRVPEGTSTAPVDVGSVVG